MKKKVCVILRATALAVTRQTPSEDPQARRTMSEKKSYGIYPRCAKAMTQDGLDGICVICALAPVKVSAVTGFFSDLAAGL
jgi:hypothetical protein